jgi:outer membrane protein assembly factor BamB
MSSARKQLLCCLIILAAAGGSAFASDWPEFLGPNGNSTSPETGLLRTWPPEGPKVLWTAPLGPGYGGAAIRDGMVYFLDRVKEAKDVLRCLDLQTGKEQWSFSSDAPGRLDHDGSRSTPAVSEKYVFTIGPFGDVHCLDRATHQVVWKQNLLNDYGVKLPEWGVAQSPLLYHDLVVIAPQSSQKGIVALDQATGKERWHSPSIGYMAYGSPMKVTLDGVEQFVIVNEDGVAAVSPADGKLLWTYSHRCGIPIPNVTFFDNNKFFVTGAYQAGSAIIQVAHEEQKWTVKELGRNRQIGGHCHPALFYQDHLYLLANVNERRDGLVCFDTNCKVVWQTSNSPNLDKGGSVLTGDGLIYIMDGRNGELHIVQPSPSGFKSLSKTKLLSGKEIWAPLALADGKLVIRDQSQAKCIEVHSER